MDNPTFDYTGPTTPNPNGSGYILTGAFANDYVLPWYPTIGTPHLAYDNSGEFPPLPCNQFGYDPTTDPAPFNCIVSSWNNNQGTIEAIGQDYSFISNGFNSYCVSGQLRTLDCLNSSQVAGRLEFRAGNNLGFVQTYQDSNLPPNPPAGDVESIGDITFPFDPNNSFDFSLSPYTPNNDYSQFEILSAIGVAGAQTISIENVSIVCETSSITDLTANINDFTVDFEAINGSNISYKSDSYSWSFGDGSTSTDIAPTKTYADFGTYEVCLEIVDENECCGTKCVEVVIPPISNCIVDDETIYIDATNPLTDNFSDLVNMGLYNSGGTLTGKDIVINGSFTLDENFTFYACHFYFESGAELIVDSPGSIAIRYSELNGCTTMWKGISVLGDESSPQNKFVFEYSTIRDAYTALSILENSNIQQQRISFIDNYIGIYSPASNMIKSHFGSAVRGSTFKGEGNMLPSYPGQPAWDAIPYCGINVASLDHLIVNATSDTYINTFEGIRNGIRFDKVNLIVENNKFVNLQLEDGFGIRGRHCSNSSFVTNDFMNVEQPIVLLASNNAKLLIKENHFYENNQSVLTNFGPTFGQLYINNVHSSEIVIENNRFEVDKIKAAGIGVYDCNSLNNIHVVNNKLQWAQQKMPIHIRNVSMQLGTKGLVSNNITIDDLVTGEMKSSINIYNSDDFIVSDNNIKSMAGQFAAYRIINSKNCLIEGNESTMLSPFFTTINYQVSMSPGNIYCCNATNDGRHGIYFIGQNIGTELRSSEFINTTKGLFLNNAEIGTQNLYGNFWENSNVSTRAEFLASLGSPDAYENSIFYVNSNQVGTRPEVVVPSQWFINTNGQANLCASNSTDPTCGSSNWDGFSSPDPNDDACELFKNELIALVGPKVYWDFQDQYDWILYFHLFDNYRDVSLSIWNDCFPIPEKNVNVKTVAEYYHTDKSYKEAYQPTENESIQLDALQSTLSNDLEDLVSLLENIETDDDYENMMSDVILLQSQINQSSNAIDSINDVIKHRGENNLQNLQNQMIGLPSDFYFLNELKYVWSVKVQIALFGYDHLSSTQWNELERIANECELEYGNAVFEAQSLLSLIGITSFDNENNCDRIEARQSIESEKDINVFPNPSSGIVTLDLANQNLENAKVRIYNLGGGVVFDAKINSLNSNKSIDLSSNPSGVYYLEIVQNAREVYRQKLILVK